MNWRQSILQLAIIVLLGYSAWQSYQRANLQTEIAQEQKKQLLGLEELLNSIQTHQVTINSQSGAILSQQAALRGTLAQRQAEFRKLEQHVQEIRDWSLGQLPDTVQRLRERPAVTGAQAYHDAMRSSRALHTDREPATDER